MARRIFKRKKEGSNRTPTPVPLVEALGRATPAPGGWRVESAAQGMAHTNIREGVMAVPLDDEECKTCKVVHGPAVRSHEMVHVAISPEEIRPLFVTATLDAFTEGMHNVDDIVKQALSDIATKSAYEPSKGSYPVDYEYQIAAEEFVVGTVLRESSRKVAHEYLCLPNYKKRLVALLGANSIKDCVLLIGSESYNRAVENLIYKLSRGTYLTAAKKLGPEHFDKAVVLAQWLYYYVYSGISRIESYVRWQYKEASRKEQLDILRDSVAILLATATGNIEKERRKREEAARARSRPVPTPLKEREEPREREETEAAGSDTEVFYRHYDKDDVAEAMKTLAAGKTPPDEGRYARWGRMSIETAPLGSKMPEWKRRRIARPAEEGSIPAYLHRYATDMKVFRTSKIGDTGLSILVDDSGSMSFTTDEIDQIVAKLPGTIIAAYAGRSDYGLLKIIAKDGRRTSRAHLHVNMGGNIVDYPALEWLAKQPEPRLWISDGYVTGVGDSGGTAAMKAQVMLLMQKARITRVDNLTQALEIINGKRALAR